jgi:hypothetical protein
MMVKDIFAIQAAGVGVEREFSIASNFNTDNKTYGPQVLGALMVNNHEQSVDARQHLWDYYSIQARENHVSDVEIEEERADRDANLSAFITQLTSLDDISDGEDTADPNDAPFEDNEEPTETRLMQNGIQYDEEGLLSEDLELVSGAGDRVRGRAQRRRRTRALRGGGGRGRGRGGGRGGGGRSRSRMLTVTPSLVRSGTSSLRSMLENNEDNNEEPIAKRTRR